jgi:DMSO reductase family type II enzyme chaperone
MNENLEVHEIERAVVRSALYKLLAKSFLYPTPQNYEYLVSNDYETLLADLQEMMEGQPDLVQSISGVRSLRKDWRGSQRREELETEYNRLFAHLGSTKCPPYETEYGFDNIYQKTEAMADISGFYSAFGLEISPQNTDRVDFFSTEMEFMSFLAVKEAHALEQQENEHGEICREAQKKFLTDHLGRWVSMFAKVLEKSSDHQFYVSLGNLAEQFLESEFMLLAVAPRKVAALEEQGKNIPEAFSCDGCVARPSANP